MDTLVIEFRVVSSTEIRRTIKVTAENLKDLLSLIPQGEGLRAVAVRLIQEVQEEVKEANDE